MGYYNDALHYCYKEYELIKDIPKEAYATLTNIAEMSFLAKKPYDQIEKACYDARNAVSINIHFYYIFYLINNTIHNKYNTLTTRWDIIYLVLI